MPAESRSPSPPSARILLVDDPRFELHASAEEHPERPQRLHAARAALNAAVRAGIAAGRVIPRTASDAELIRVHDARFLDELGTLRGRSAYLDPDTYVSAQSVDVARLAAGSLVALIDQLIDGEVPKGVALLRPPGHHARPSQAMGFCLLNNVAVAAAHARARGLERVAIVDWDVHHGNGTQEIFWRDPNVLYLSTHQYPFYPGTGAAEERGEGEGTGFTVNVPLAPFRGDAVYASAFERVILPIVEEYRPELVLISAGFDAALRDPLAQMELSAGAFGWMAQSLARVANHHAKGRLALVLEGGYDLPSLEEGLQSAVTGMVLEDAPELRRANDDAGVARAAQAAKRAWPVVS
jgi:acetoin utilization deacetylase AcuC-like enzyme